MVFRDRDNIYMSPSKFVYCVVWLIKKNRDQNCQKLTLVKLPTCIALAHDHRIHTNMSESDLFGDIHENILPADFDLDDDQIDFPTETRGAGSGSRGPGIEVAGEVEGDDGCYVDTEDMYPDLNSALKSLSTKLSDHGIKLRKEWTTMISRRFHVSGPLYPSHLDMFVLGIQAERNVGLNSDLKETAKRVQEEANHMCGERKKMSDSAEKVISDFSKIMRDMQHQIQEMSQVTENIKAASREASEIGSISDALELTRPKTVQDLLRDLGFQESSINHPIMKDHIDKVAPASFVERYFKSRDRQDKEKVREYILAGVKEHKEAAERAKLSKAKSVLV
nr:phosphoprotein [Colocasia bobone disease-associated virus]